MRTLIVATVTVVVVALAGGCALDGESNGSDDGQGTGTLGEATPLDPETSSAPSPRPGDVVDSEACEEVRTGIEAFNVGAFDETVEHFEEALPLAEEQDDGSVLASQLIEAVRYYAELDAELYPEAARSSPDFARYKAITLGQCMPRTDESPESPGVDI
ncbi:MAG: hypothetical protein LH477_16615 [Nocardioides sp.]|nr:hypothetical protein [Nocardioides sp.]